MSHIVTSPNKTAIEIKTNFIVITSTSSYTKIINPYQKIFNAEVTAWNNET